MNFKRMMALLLCALMLFSAVACGAADKAADTTTAAVQDGTADASADTTTEAVPEQTGPALDKWGREVVEDTVPTDLDFGGKTLNILARLDTAGKNRWRVDFYSPEVNGEVLNDAVYNRNALISERLNISFSVHLFVAQIAADDIAVLDPSGAAQHGTARRFGSYYNIAGFDGVYCSIAAGMSCLAVFIFIDQDNIIFAYDPFQINAVGKRDAGRGGIFGLFEFKRIGIRIIGLNFRLFICSRSFRCRSGVYEHIFTE